MTNTPGAVTESPAKGGRAARYRVRVDPERCKGCALCLEFCRRKALVMAKGLNARGAHYVTPVAGEGCTGCLQCALMCPDAAIEIERAEE